MANDLHLRRERVNRRDFNAAAVEFLQRQAFVSKQRLLDADIAVKAMMPSAKQSAKNTSGGQTGNEPRLVYDSSATKRPGQWFKHWATVGELERSGDEPNFGWMDPEPAQTPGDRERIKKAVIEKYRRRPKITIERFPVNPRTGMADMDSPETFRQKALGPSLRNLMPGGSAGARAAAGAGLIVDDLGKFRCPPGTPAANQFTDAFGSNCFKPANVVRSMLADLGSILRGRFQYVDPNLLGLDPDKMPAVREAVKNIAGTEDDLREAMAKATAAIDALRSRLGTGSDRTNNADLVEIFQALEAAGDLPFDWKDLLTDAWGTKFNWDDNRSVSENLERFEQNLKESFLDFFGEDQKGRDGFAQMWYSDDPFAVQEIDEMFGRYMSSMRGAMTSLLHMKEEHPDTFKRMGSVRSVIPDPEDPENPWGRMGYARVDSQGLLGIDFNFAHAAFDKFMRDADGNLIETLAVDGKWTFISAAGEATEAEKLDAIREFMKNAVRNEAFAVQYMQEYGSDIAEALYMSQQAKMMQVGYHEFAHVAQYTMAQDHINERLATVGFVQLADGTQLAGPVSSWTAAEYANALTDTLLYPVLNENEGRIPPVGVTGLEGDMLHLLAGGYYQKFVQDWLAARRSGDNSEAAKLQGVIVMEAMAEMFSLRQMGILKGDAVDDSVDWMFEADPALPPAPTAPGPPSPTPSGPNPPSTPGGGPGGRPRITPNPADPDTDAGADNVPYIPYEVETIVDTETGEIVPATTPWNRFKDLWRIKTSRGWDQTAADVRVAEAQKERSHINAEFGFDDMSYDYLSASELNTRFELMRDEADRLLGEAGVRKLTNDEATQLWLAMRGMEQILNQNNRRKRMSPDAAAKARREGKQTSYGSYYKSTLTEGGFDFEKYENALHSLAKSLGNENNPFTPTKGKDRVDGGMAIFDNLPEARRPYMGVSTETMRNGASLRTTAHFDDAIKSAVARKRASAPGSKPVRMPSDDIKDFVLPIMRDMDATPLSQDTTIRVSLDGVEGLAIGDSIDHSSFINGRIVNADTESVAQATPEVGSPTVRIVMPKGSKGLYGDDDKNGDVTSLLIPPGTLRVIQIDDDGTIVVTPIKQKSLDEVSIDIEKSVKGFSSTADSAERRERRKIKTLAKQARGSSDSPRKGFASTTSTRSADVTTAIHAEHRRRVSLERARTEHNFEPFDLTNDQIEELRSLVAAQQAEGINYSTEIGILQGNSLLRLRPETRQSRAERKRGHRESTIATLREMAMAGGGNVGSNDYLVIDMDPVVKDFLATASEDEIAATVESALLDYAQGFDRRIRVAVSKERLDSVRQSGRYMTTHETKSDHSAPGIRRQVEFGLGYPLDAPADIRPASGYVTHSGFDKMKQEAILALEESGSFSGIKFAKRDHNFATGLNVDTSAQAIYGESTIVLKQDVSLRSAMQDGDSARDSVNMPARFSSNDVDEWMVALAPDEGGGQSKRFYHSLLQAHLTGDNTMLLRPDVASSLSEKGPDAARQKARTQSSNTYFEALVHAGFELDDIEHVKVDIANLRDIPHSPADLGANDESVTSALRDAGLTESEIAQVFSMLANNDKSFDFIVNLMPHLRAAVKAQDEHKKWSDQGIDLIATNPWAVDILDPDTYLSLPHPYKIEPGDSVSVLKQFVANQIRSRADKIAAKLKPVQKPVASGAVV